MTLTLWMVLAVILILLGLAGTILPALPGTLLVFCGLALAAWAEGFQEVSAWWLVVLGALVGLSYLVEFIATAMGTKKTGASPRAFWGAAIGSVVGIFFGIPGLIVGPFLGAVIGELTSKTGLRTAAKAGYGAWIGLLVGTVVKVSLAFFMVGIFVLARIF